MRKKQFWAMGITIWMVMAVAAWAQGPSRYVSFKLKLGKGEAEVYDLANKSIRLFTAFGTLDYPLDKIKRLHGDGKDGQCEMETTYGDRIVGKLITQTLAYYYFDKERMLGLEDGQSFDLEAVQPAMPAFDGDVYFWVELLDGSRFLAIGDQLAIPVSVNDEQLDLDLAFVRQIRFKISKSRDKTETLRFESSYAGGFPIKGEVVNPFATIRFQDVFGNRVDVALRQLSSVEGPHRCFVENEARAATEGEAMLTLLDGRQERVRIPYGMWRIVRRGEDDYEIPSPLVNRAVRQEDGSVVVDLISGDSIRGFFGGKTISLFPIRGEGEPVNVGADSIARLEQRDWSPAIQGPWLLLELEGLVLVGRPSGEMRMTARASREMALPRWDEMLLVQPDGPDWRVVTETTNMICSATDRNINWYCLFDGKTRAFRWKEVKRIGRPGVSVQENTEPAVVDGEASVETPEQATIAPVLEGTTIHPQMQPGHVLQIVVMIAGEKEIDDPARRVSSRGDISLPLLGEVKVAGLTLEQLASRLTSLYGEYLRNPQVTVQFVKDDTSDAVSPWGSVTVLGTVKEPGKVSIPPTLDLTVSMAIQLAGGFGPSAKDTAIRITRPDAEGTGAQFFDVNLRRVGSKGELENDMLLHPGDIVYVPEMIF